MEHDALLIEVLHVEVLAAPVLAELHNVADVVFGEHYRRLDDGLFHVVDRVDRRHVRRVRALDHLAAGEVYVIDNGRRRADEVEVELALEPFLDHFVVQKAEEAASKAEAQGRRRLGIERQRRIVQA